MAATEHPLQALSGFLPEGSFQQVADYLHQYRVHLTITRMRKSVLGDYRHANAYGGGNHRITVNGNLNAYEFLITLLHELAHLLTFELYQHRVEPHGKEWKQQYSQLLSTFVAQKIFPPDISRALQKSIRNPAATANGETDLLLVLRKYNRQTKEGVVTLNEIEDGAWFETDNGRTFQKISKRRKRFTCIEKGSGLHYSFSAVTEVRKISQ
ncbi:MAG: SprT family zinc-dependent metalloprotease [Sediminibacterium sp.]|nr:SprT family zinc-dependent metalloprotease [Sediminibacterium sp.]